MLLERAKEEQKRKEHPSAHDNAGQNHLIDNYWDLPLGMFSIN